MIDPLEAQKLILKHSSILSCEQVSLEMAVNRILSEDLYAKDNLPPFDNSAMDGYAVRAEDIRAVSQENPIFLVVREVVKAGSLSKEEICPGQAIKIMTGAALPKGFQVLRVLSERALQSGVDHFRNRLVRRRRLQPKRSVNFGFEVDGRASCGAHDATLAPRR